TGVGGILRDVFTMGARPIALLDSLRFGPLDEPHQRHLLEGVVAGIGGYGNCMGVPTVGGEVYFDESYRHNCLVNAMCVGVVEHDVARVARRERGMTPYEVMLSESQERMLIVVRRGEEEGVRAAFARWDLRSDVVGTITGDGQIRVRDGGEVVADLPLPMLVD